MNSDTDLDHDAIVWAGTVIETPRIRGMEEIRSYIEHFTALREAASEGEPLRVFLRALITGCQTTVKILVLTSKADQD